MQDPTRSDSHSNIQVHRFFFTVLLLAAGILAASCNSGGSDGNDSDSGKDVDKAAWTYMVYMAADNDISDCAAEDIKEMETVGSTSDVNVVVEARFSSEYTPSMPSATLRGRVERDEDAQTVGSWYSSIGDTDMTKPESLTEFINWAVQNYPADHYALVLWSHGAGWKADPDSAAFKGMITNSSGTPMSLPDLAGAVRGSGVVFDIINFDTCLMGMYEVAYEFKGTASYLAFSEEEYPAYGDPYDAILQELTGNPTMSGEQLALGIVNKCNESYTGSDIPMTKSAVRMDRVENLHYYLCSLAQYLVNNINNERTNIETARYVSISYDYPENHDLGDFLEQLAEKTSTQALKSIIVQVQGALANTVISHVVNSPDDTITGSQGLAIYIPSKGEYSLNDLARYDSLSCNASGVTWYDFVRSFVQAL